MPGVADAPLAAPPPLRPAGRAPVRRIRAALPPDTQQGLLCSVAEYMPLKYADYSFQVRVNDQFDRSSAPIERRYKREDVEQRLVGAGLVETRGTGHRG